MWWAWEGGVSGMCRGGQDGSYDANELEYHGQSKENDVTVVAVHGRSCHFHSMYMCGKNKAKSARRFGRPAAGLVRLHRCMQGDEEKRRDAVCAALGLCPVCVRVEQELAWLGWSAGPGAIGREEKY